MAQLQSWTEHITTTIAYLQVEASFQHRMITIQMVADGSQIYITKLDWFYQFGQWFLYLQNYIKLPLFFPKK